MRFGMTEKLGLFPQPEPIALDKDFDTQPTPVSSLQPTPR
jgi:hypothetical protein